MKKHALAVRETVDARKIKYAEADLGVLFQGATEVVVAKGKKVLSFDPRKDAAALAAEALGRSGTLRAPTIKVGKRYLIGYGDEAWSQFFG